MNLKQAHIVMQNLVTIHWNIHWGIIDGSTCEPKESYDFHFSSIDNYIFYNQVFSEYAIHLDNYMTCVVENSIAKDDLCKFENDLREGIESMIHYIEKYHIDLNTKKKFIELSDIDTVFKIVDIDKRDVLKRIQKFHEVHEIKTIDEYPSKYDLQIENMKNRIKKNSIKSENIKLEAMKNLKDWAELSKKRSNYRYSHKVNSLDRFVPNYIYQSALANEMENIKIQKKRGKRKEIWKKLKGLRNNKNTST
ncbi:hypothetical protein QP65_00410 [Staphylococcus aureus]|uniref:hypothetical protein n=1 Tax=Staphylococcus aureus TaxID=1280 RepID=UPI0005C24DFF|nr:hypothetical protein [Staphylococcus aureus]KIT67597.1 hypothetical protein QP65_00410 [Staphylococcus aureus]HDA1066335.1 hypothetical protein [Staphylococcus aureus]